MQASEPVGGTDCKIQKSFHGVILLDGRNVCHQPLPYFGSCCLGRFARHAQKREHHNGEVALKFAFGGRRRQTLRVGIGAVKLFHGFHHSFGNNSFYIHKYSVRNKA